MKSICLFTQGNKAKYERYLEAWHLLWRAPEAGTGIEIHACVDEALNYQDEMDWKEENGSHPITISEVRTFRKSRR
jgi:hypothetical protein